MVDLSGREHRLLDVSKVRDNRYKGAGIAISDDNRARGSAAFCAWLVGANTAHDGKSPFPYGIYALEGALDDITDPTPELQSGPFLEIYPCDRPDRRAVKVTWNETGTEAEFSFVALAMLLGINAPKGTTLWIDAIPVLDKKGKPVAALPLGERIKRQAVQEVAASKEQGVPGAP